MTRLTRLSGALATLLALACMTALPAAAAPAPAPYANGFENPGDAVAGPPYTSDDAFFNVDRVASGTGGVTSAAGAWHAEAALTDYSTHGSDGFLFTRYGGYSSAFPADGYTTSVDIYLDTAESDPGEDARLDWSSSISTPAGDHRRDFIFAVGTDGSGGYVMSASNNAPGWPANPGRDPFTITESGWYSFQHRFYDSGGGVLAVDMSVVDADGTVLKTWTLSTASDVIGSTVGGNRYGWLVTNDFPGLPIDNVTRSGAVATDKDDCKKGGWKDVFRADGSSFKNQGDCIQYVNTGK